MATAVKNTMETTAVPQPQPNLLRVSLVGAVYVVVCLGLVLFGLPYLWKQTVAGWIAVHLGAFFDPAGMAVLLVAAVVGLLVLGLKLAGSHPPAGLRAGVFTFVAGGVLLFLAMVAVGDILEAYLIKDRTSKIGLALMFAAGVAIVVALVKYVLVGGALERFLISFEGQGWFGARPYKSNQGLRVRRLTMLGILLLVGSGVYTMIEHKSLSGDWRVRLPYTEDLISEGHRLVATLLPDIRYTAPILLVALGLWIAWRAVNYPAFADFLIATEAELNKVSWVTRRRLVQDTIVVLVTLALFAVFLLLIDQLWGWLLTRETLGGIVPKPVPKQTREAGRDLPW